MFQLQVTGPRSASALFYWELVLQTRIATHFYERLASFARTELTHERFESVPDRSDSPIEIFADCAGFLGACTVIFRVLFSVKSRDSKSRAKALREALGIGALPALQATAVRNSFEHIDERIDKELSRNPAGTFIHLKCDASPMPPATTALKRFNPRTYRISYLDIEVDIRACYTDVLTVKAALEKPGAASATRNQRGRSEA